MTVEQPRNTVDDSGCIDCLALEILHNVQKVIIYVRLVLKLDLDHLEVR